jgi:hypothetical protein
MGLEQLQDVPAGDVRQDQVDEDQIEPAGILGQGQAELFGRRGDRGRGPAPGHQLRDEFLDDLVVLDDQDLLGWSHSVSRQA